jgi:CSLREA domain-containing protein
VPFAHTFTVTSTGDAGDPNPGDGFCRTGGSPPGPCTLRAAIQEADALVGRDDIVFGIGTGAQTISPLSALPAITEAVTIDGTTQPGFAQDPLIQLNG